MIRCKTQILSLSLLGLIAACGSAPEYDAGLEARQPREARVKITAALDVSSMVDQSLVDRLVIEDIQVNLADVRLLGADPRIPAGGLPLLNQNQIVRLGGNFESALELPFPQHFVRQDDLAVYLRVDKAEALEWSSVVISGRLYSEPVDFSSLKYLTAEAQDPDGDPCRDGAQDPDGDPAKCAKKNGLAAAATMAQQSVEFELRGDDVADLVATLDQDAELDVVVATTAVDGQAVNLSECPNQVVATVGVDGGAGAEGPLVCIERVSPLATPIVEASDTIEPDEFGVVVPGAGTNAEPPCDRRSEHGETILAATADQRQRSPEFAVGHFNASSRSRPVRAGPNRGATVDCHAVHRQVPTVLTKVDRQVSGQFHSPEIDPVAAIPG